jgi:hypothetical protein
MKNEESWKDMIWQKEQDLNVIKRRKLARPHCSESSVSLVEDK